MKLTPHVIERTSSLRILGKAFASTVVSNENKAVVEERPDEKPPDLTLRALEQRIRQQEILSELGVIALQGAAFDALLAETVRLTAQGLRVQFCKVLRYIPDENRFVVQAGVGWDPGIVGVASIGADLESPAGFALRTGKPVISNHLKNEERFRTPGVLTQHGIKRAMNVILQGDGRPFGVLEVDSQSDNEFVEHDLAFLQGAANVLGMAIERERNERHLKAALERQQFLVKEMNHRVKNSLTIVASLLQMQARNVADQETIEQFEEAARRVTAIARAHERLYRNNYIESMDLGIYVEEVCQDMETSVAHCTIHVEAERGIHVKIDNAISVALIVVELVTNSAKYGYPNGSSGKIWIGITRNGDGNILITVRDEGSGLPADFDPQKSRGLGMRIVNAFANQLNTKLKFTRLSPGSEFKLLFPVDIVQR
jgi:two-component sensor histidine kinase